MSKNTGGPAFPILADVRPDIDKDWCGMTLRDYFAAKALQGFTTQTEPPYEHVDDFAKYSYMLADAMLKARES